MARIHGAASPPVGERLRNLRYRFSLQKFVAELLEKRWMEPVIPLGLLIAALVYFTVTLENFGTLPSLLQTSIELASFALVCFGMAMVIISGGIDLSVSSMFALCNIIVLILLKLTGLPVPVAVLLTLFVGAFLGALNGAVVAFLKARPFLATLATLIIFRGIVNLLDVKYSVDLGAVFIQDPVWSWLSRGTIATLPTPLAILLVVLALGHILLSRSRIGWHVTAVGASRRAARHAGISVSKTLMFTYIFSGVMCALGAILYAARVDSSSSRVGEGMEIQVLTAVVVGGISLTGGRGTLPRALIGAALVVTLGRGLLLQNVPGSVYTMILAAVLLVAVGIDIKWAKNRGKTIQKIYVIPTRILYPPLVDTSPDANNVFAQNNRLQGAEALGLDVIEGPEDVILDRQGRLYGGDRRGWIHRFSGENFEHHEIFARPGGYPVGMAFDEQQNLVVCIAGMGLYSVAPDKTVKKLTAQTNRTWYKVKDDSRLRLADDCDVAPDGKIYFSEASVRFEMHDWILDGLEGRPNGRLVCYDPATDRTKTVVKNLVFPNGICSCHDGESVLIAQTWLCRVLRFWHSGLRAGRLEMFLDNLPGYVDNINRASDGGYWVALNGMRSPCYDLAMEMPVFRRRMMKRIPRDEWLYPSMNHGCVVHVADNGEVLSAFWDPGGTSHATITSMREHDGSLYIGGLDNNKIGRIKLAGFEVTCTCGQPPCLSRSADESARDPRRDEFAGIMSEK